MTNLLSPLKMPNISKGVSKIGPGIPIPWWLLELGKMRHYGHSNRVLSVLCHLVCQFFHTYYSLTKTGLSIVYWTIEKALFSPKKDSAIRFAFKKCCHSSTYYSSQNSSTWRHFMELKRLHKANCTSRIRARNWKSLNFISGVSHYFLLMSYMQYVCLPYKILC